MVFKIKLLIFNGLLEQLSVGCRPRFHYRKISGIVIVRSAESLIKAETFGVIVMFLFIPALLVLPVPVVNRDIKLNCCCESVYAVIHIEF